MFKIEDVINKKIKYKNGHEGIIVAYDKYNNMLLTQWENGNVSGFGRLEDIVEIIENKD